MKDEPFLDRSALSAHLQREYRLEIECLTFVPKGFASHCYVAQTSEGARYFLKICALTRIGRRNAERLGVWLPLLAALHEQNLFPFVPKPVRTVRGAFSSCFAGMALALTHYIEGQTLNPAEHLSDDTLRQIARAAAHIHQCTDALDLSGVPIEQFANPFEHELCQGLAVLDTISTRAGSAQQALRALLAPRRDDVLALLERLHDLQCWARAHASARVLCHTDLHGDNLVLDRDGTLHVIDWEAPLLAPPEHDVMFYARDRLDVFLDAYEQVRGPVALDSRIFGFYFYRRNLEDMTDWIVRILYEHQGEAQNELDLAELATYIIPQWSRLDTSMNQVEQVLAHRGATLSR